VQGDPYRWGHGYMTGYVPDPSLPVTPKAPIIPLDVAHSTLSPQSILQSSMNGVPLASGIAADKNSLQIDGKPKVIDGKVTVKLKAGQQGTANLFVWSNQKTVDKKTVSFTGNKTAEVMLNCPADMPMAGCYLLISYETTDGKTLALSYPLDK
jgi:hypothetical protein